MGAEDDRPRDHRGRSIDFGSRAVDYDRHRPGFPPRFFAELETRRWVAPGMRALDLGTGTGSLALGWAARGMRTTALDISEALLEVTAARAKAAGVDVATCRATAEASGLAADSFELISAGQCWWWFDTQRTLDEIDRLLVADGRLLICNFSYLPLPGSLAERTEAMILSMNPGWTMAGWRGIHPEQVRALDEAGFADVESFSFVEQVPFSHEGWRGRMRTCNGVGSALTEEEVRRFDTELAALLAADYPETVDVAHRVFAVSGRKESSDTAAFRASTVPVQFPPT
jgi:ubiquinone/menaquinone biosynthesis C-methylase UbiE